jgi:hypothetical protein
MPRHVVLVQDVQRKAVNASVQVAKLEEKFWGMALTGS